MINLRKLYQTNEATIRSNALARLKNRSSKKESFGVFIISLSADVFALRYRASR